MHAVAAPGVQALLGVAYFMSLGADFDVVVTTALVPGRPAPKLVSADQVRTMKRGAVIVATIGIVVFVPESPVRTPGKISILLMLLAFTTVSAVLGKSTLRGKRASSIKMPSRAP